MLRDSSHSARDWAALSLRFSAAWANWRLAHGEATGWMPPPEPEVCAWRGLADFAVCAGECVGSYFPSFRVATDLPEQVAPAERRRGRGSPASAALAR